MDVATAARVRKPFLRVPTMSNGKSPYKRDELQKFRQLLIRKREQFLESLHALEDEVKGYNEPESHSTQSDMPTHPADQSDRTYEQMKDLQIATNERDMIREIEEALRRVDDGTYGVCLECGKPIERHRLEVQPWANLCIDDAR
jgi:DnaK suppressor protein